MLETGWTPSIVSNPGDHTVYLVLDDLGHNGSVWREADAEATDLETVITDLLTGQYEDPLRVVGFNTVEGWSQDVSADIAHELRHGCDLQMRDVPFYLQDFVDCHEGRYHQGILSFLLPPIECGLFQKNSRLPVAASAY